MNDQYSSDSQPESLEGHRFQAESEAVLRKIIGQVCDYRGDVTIFLNTGERINGYVFDRQEGIPVPYIKMFLPDRTDPFIVKYQDIAEIEFSGEDTAFGRSWEDWAKKWQKPSTT